MVGADARSFILSLPTGVEDSHSWPVIFNWHGLGDTAQNMSGMISGYVNNADMPFIGVTPEDMGYTLPMVGMELDWDILNVDANNKELAFFDAVLDCVDQKYGVDENHIHTMGFSLGSITSDMLGTMRGEILASIATYSGMYWNNPANVPGMLNSAINWPAYTVENDYAQLFFHGGLEDYYSLVVASLKFNEAAVSDSALLGTLGHDTIICDHGLGHTAPAPGMGPSQIIKFFADHPMGTVVSPYNDAGLPTGFSDSCVFQPSNQ
jgi:hypothetical protein